MTAKFGRLFSKLSKISTLSSKQRSRIIFTTFKIDFLHTSVVADIESLLKRFCRVTFWGAKRSKTFFWWGHISKNGFIIPLKLQLKVSFRISSAKSELGNSNLVKRVKGDATIDQSGSKLWKHLPGVSKLHKSSASIDDPDLASEITKISVRGCNCSVSENLSE